MTLPKISVITTSFNQGQYIRDNINSVLLQEYPNFEHIVIDGGSTDDTLSVLKSYPHLKWVSEPDHGQADALNKGFSMATGDIIAWLNSDDMYNSEAFKTAAELLKEYPIIIGACAIVDQDRKPLYTVPNTERNWFDILKYWVPYSIPAQPSIFFKRDLLELTKRSTGNFLDKSLYYTMDYDLWMRITLKFPLIKRTEKILSLYRTTETSKTSHDTPGMAYAEPEMSYIFKRAETVATAPTNTYGIIIPATSASNELKRTIESILTQSLRDFQITIVDHSGDKTHAKNLKELASQLNHNQNEARIDQYIRVVQSQFKNLNLALNETIENCEARIIAILPSGSMVGTNFLSQLNLLFSNDRVGACLPIRHSFNLANHFTPSKEFTCPNSQLDFKLDALLTSPTLPLALIARKTTLLEVGDLEENVDWQLSVRKLLLRATYKAWHVSALHDIPVTFQSIPQDNLDRNLLAAQTLLDIFDFYTNDLFAKARFGYGVIGPIAEPLLEQCKQLTGSK